MRLSLLVAVLLFVAISHASMFDDFQSFVKGIVSEPTGRATCGGICYGVGISFNCAADQVCYYPGEEDSPGMCVASSECAGATTTTVPSCTNECSAGSAYCSSTSAIRTCGNYDADSCLEWSTSSCPGGATCEYAGATPYCYTPSSATTTTSCSPWTYCSGSSVYTLTSTCQTNYITTCAGTCSDGACVTATTTTAVATASCTYECYSNGLTQCSGSSSHQTCGFYDADSCLEWSEPTWCGGGTVCSAGACVAATTTTQSTSAATTATTLIGATTTTIAPATGTTQTGAVTTTTIASSSCQQKPLCYNPAKGGTFYCAAGEKCVFPDDGGAEGMCVSDSKCSGPVYTAPSCWKCEPQLYSQWRGDGSCDTFCGETVDATSSCYENACVVATTPVVGATTTTTLPVKTAMTTTTTIDTCSKEEVCFSASKGIFYCAKGEKCAFLSGSDGVCTGKSECTVTKVGGVLKVPSVALCGGACGTATCNANEKCSADKCAAATECSYDMAVSVTSIQAGTRIAYIEYAVKNAGGAPSPLGSATVDYGDGSAPSTVSIATLAAGEERKITASHTYMLAGTYAVKITIASKDANMANNEAMGTVVYGSAKGTFQSDKLSYAINDDIKLTVTATSAKRVELLYGNRWATFACPATAACSNTWTLKASAAGKKVYMARIMTGDGSYSDLPPVEIDVAGKTSCPFSCMTDGECAVKGGVLYPNFACSAESAAPGVGVANVCCSVKTGKVNQATMTFLDTVEGALDNELAPLRVGYFEGYTDSLKEVPVLLAGAAKDALQYSTATVTPWQGGKDLFMRGLTIFGIATAPIFRMTADITFVYRAQKGMRLEDITNQIATYDIVKKELQGGRTLGDVLKSYKAMQQEIVSYKTGAPKQRTDFLYNKYIVPSEDFMKNCEAVRKDLSSHSPDEVQPCLDPAGVQLAILALYAKEEETILNVATDPILNALAAYDDATRAGREGTEEAMSVYYQLGERFYNKGEFDSAVEAYDVPATALPASPAGSASQARLKELSSTGHKAKRILFHLVASATDPTSYIPVHLCLVKCDLLSKIAFKPKLLTVKTADKVLPVLTKAHGLTEKSAQHVLDVMRVVDPEPSALARIAPELLDAAPVKSVADALKKLGTNLLPPEKLQSLTSILKKSDIILNSNEKSILARTLIEKPISESSIVEILEQGIDASSKAKNEFLAIMKDDAKLTVSFVLSEDEKVAALAETLIDAKRKLAAHASEQEVAEILKRTQDFDTLIAIRDNPEMARKLVAEISAISDEVAREILNKVAVKRLLILTNAAQENLIAILKQSKIIRSSEDKIVAANNIVAATSTGGWISENAMIEVLEKGMSASASARTQLFELMKGRNIYLAETMPTLYNARRAVSSTDLPFIDLTDITRPRKDAELQQITDALKDAEDRLKALVSEEDMLKIEYDTPNMDEFMRISRDSPGNVRKYLTSIGAITFDDSEKSLIYKYAVDMSPGELEKSVRSVLKKSPAIYDSLLYRENAIYMLSYGVSEDAVVQALEKGPLSVARAVQDELFEKFIKPAYAVSSKDYGIPLLESILQTDVTKRIGALKLALPKAPVFDQYKIILEMREALMSQGKSAEADALIAANRDTLIKSRYFAAAKTRAAIFSKYAIKPDEPLSLEARQFFADQINTFTHRRGENVITATDLEGASIANAQQFAAETGDRLYDIAIHIKIPKWDGSTIATASDGILELPKSIAQKFGQDKSTRGFYLSPTVIEPSDSVFVNLGGLVVGADDIVESGAQAGKMSAYDIGKHEATHYTHFALVVPYKPTPQQRLLSEIAGYFAQGELKQNKQSVINTLTLSYVPSIAPKGEGFIYESYLRDAVSTVFHLSDNGIPDYQIVDMLRKSDNFESFNKMLHATPEQLSSIAENAPAKARVEERNYIISKYLGNDAKIIRAEEITDERVAAFVVLLRSSKDYSPTMLNERFVNYYGISYDDFDAFVRSSGARAVREMRETVKDQTQNMKDFLALSDSIILRKVSQTTNMEATELTNLIKAQAGKPLKTVDMSSPATIWVQAKISTAMEKSLNDIKGFDEIVAEARMAKLGTSSEEMVKLVSKTGDTAQAAKEFAKTYMNALDPTFKYGELKITGSLEEGSKGLLTSVLKTDGDFKNFDLWEAAMEAMQIKGQKLKLVEARTGISDIVAKTQEIIVAVTTEGGQTEEFLLKIPLPENIDASSMIALSNVRRPSEVVFVRPVDSAKNLVQIILEKILPPDKLSVARYSEIISGVAPVSEKATLEATYPTISQYATKGTAAEVKQAADIISQLRQAGFSERDIMAMTAPPSGILAKDFMTVAKERISEHTTKEVVKETAKEESKEA